MDRNKKTKIQHSSESLFILGKDRKRNDGSSTIPPASKKARIAPTSTHSASTSSTSNSAAVTESWEDAINVECENINLISSVLQATGKLIN